VSRKSLAVVAALYLVSGGLVLAGGYWLAGFVKGVRCNGHYFGYSSWLSNWDGQWYQFIAHSGYRYEDAHGYAPQVFFPLYPLLGWLLEKLTPMHGQLPLVAVSWAAAGAFCLVWLRYGAHRLRGSASGAPLWGLAIILLWPASYFLRIAYTESLYLLLLALLFLGFARDWPPSALIFVTGLLTATRPTAVVACIVLAMHLFRRNTTDAPRRRLWLATGAALLSAWGLYLYMAYLQWEFGDALLFVKRQAAWNYNMPADVFFERWREMFSLRPAWQFIVDGSLLRPSTYPWNLQNRGMWLVAVGLIALGRWRRWLSTDEFAFSVLTVLLVYYTHGPKDMESVGRYLLTLLPLYLVMTRVLMQVAAPMRVLFLVSSGLLLMVQSAHFRLWHCVF
jgi:hypothetical protein